ncbi:MAG: hypothetical protein IJK04_00520 [Kiritimatiellae bacterium]|nr:hypothetical protein [Kiritimatiellia bacterium]
MKKTLTSTFLAATAFAAALIATTAGADIGDNGSADTIVWDDPGIPSGSALVKVGSNRAIVQTASAINADIDVQGGSLVFSGRTCTNEWYRFLFNGSEYGNNIQIAIGDLHVYSDTTKTEDVAQGIGASGKVLSANTAASSLQPGYCVASFATTTTKPSGQTCSLWDLRNAFDNNRTAAVLSKDTYYIYNNASQVWVAFRMAAGNNRVQSYLPVTSWLTWHWHPSAWHFQTSVDGVNWQTVDTQTSAVSSSGYGSTPFVIKGFLANGAAGFDPAANVKVASGATLDATGVAGGQTLSHLTVDWAAGAGTIRGVAIAQNGVLDLVNVPAGTDFGGKTVPVTLSGVASGSNFSNWTVRVNGAATDNVISWNGTSLRFPIISIGDNGADDTVLWDAPFLLEGSPLVKVGSNRAIVQTASAIGADIDVQGGTMVFSGRTCTNEFYRFVFNGTQYGASSQIAIGDLRLYSGTTMNGDEEVAHGIGADGNVLSAGTSAPNLGKGQCVASFATTTTKPSGQTSMNLWDLRNAFDNKPYDAVLSANSYYIYNGASTQWVAFRMAEGKNRVQSYLPVKSYIIWHWHPSAWLFQTSVDGAYWTTIDVQTGALTDAGYGSTPFVIKGFLADGAAGFDPAADVKVASGATLDASGVAGGQTLSHLTVDWTAGAGTIRGVTIAQNGVLDLVNVPDGARIGGKTVPVTLSGIANGANFTSWTVRVNGVATSEELRWTGTALRIPGAFVLSIW